MNEQPEVDKPTRKRRGGTAMLSLFLAVCAGVAAYTIGKPLLVGDAPQPWAQTDPQAQTTGEPGTDAAPRTPQAERLLNPTGDLRAVVAQANLHRHLNDTYQGFPTPDGIVVLQADTDNLVLARTDGACEVGGVIGRTARHPVPDPTGLACTDAGTALGLLRR